MKAHNRAPHPVLEEGSIPEPLAVTATSALQGVLSAGSNDDASGPSLLGMIKDVGRRLSIGGGGHRPSTGSGGSGPRMGRELGAFCCALCLHKEADWKRLSLSFMRLIECNWIDAD